MYCRKEIDICHCESCIDKSHKYKPNTFTIISHDGLDYISYEPKANDTLYLPNNNIYHISLNTLAYSNIIKLDISNNKIKYLPEYLPKLTDLNCSNNLISVIHNYPNLKILICNDNTIKSIPETIPLVKLIANNNPIKGIRNQTLKYLEALNCPIHTIYIIPGLERRSSFLDGRNIKWITIRSEKINSERILIDWPNLNFDSELIHNLNRIYGIGKLFLYINFSRFH
jgi:Leucine-rich repeat (LRR) protein